MMKKTKLSKYSPSSIIQQQCSAAVDLTFSAECRKNCFSPFWTDHLFLPKKRKCTWRAFEFFKLWKRKMNEWMITIKKGNGWQMIEILFYKRKKQKKNTNKMFNDERMSQDQQQSNRVGSKYCSPAPNFNLHLLIIITPSWWQR